jgi:hypothetical protein
MSYKRFDRKMTHQEWLEKPETVPEPYLQAVVIGLFRQGAKWEDIAAVLRISPIYAEAIVTEYFKTKTD